MSYNFSGSSTSKSSYHQQVTTPSSGFWLKPSIREPLGKTTKLVVLGLISLVLGSQRALALPTGGQVASGTATIGQPDATHMNINQTTDRAVINWQEFNIGSQEGVTFIQPSATSATLNRVTGSTPSDIAGSINANGQIMLVNPNGILFQNTANVDVSGLVATTLNISDTNFLSGLLPNQATSPAWSFSTSSGKTPATVENQGNITIRNSGFAALVAPTVTNSGTINALLGKVVLGSGTAATVDFRGDRLISLAVTPGLKTSVSNSGNLIADGGVVKLSARSGAAVLDNVINTTGLIQAQSANNQNGKIVLEGGNNGTVTVAGSLNAAGRVDVTGKTVQVSTGNITAPNAKFTAQGDLTFNQNYTSGGGNLELLTTGTGNISTQKISTQGGTLSINSKNSINTNGADLDSTNGASNGGKITLLANNNITTGSILSLSRNDAGNAGNGGIVSATATNGNITTGNIDSSSSSPVGTTGAGGNVTLTAKGSSGGDINVQGISSGSFASSTAGIGGNVSLTAANTINIGNINNVANTKNNYGNISLTGNEINLNGGDNSIRGDGKTVLMQSSSPGQKIRIGSSDTNATDTLDLTSTDVAALKDGFSNITIGRTNGSGAVTIDPVTFFDPVKIQATGVGGTILANGTISGASGSNSSISLLANGNINTQGIKTYGNTINILSNNGGITTNGQALDTTNGASNGGAMTLTAKNGDINTGNLNTSSTNIDGNAGKGGSIALTATGSSGGNININGSVSTGAYASGNVGYGGNVTFKANNSLTLGSVNQGFASNFSNGSVILQASNIYLNPGATTIFGDSITATGPITAANAPNSSITLGASRNISTQAIRTYGNALTMASLKGSITTNNQHLNTTNGASDAGGISLGAYNGISTGNISSNSYLATGSGNVGKGGDINLTNINGNISTGVVNSS
nr:filamentous hemagglutinin N-terminal domain-containing protein [Aphanothece sp. CMT-3BRIN-NPC111]